MEVAKASFVDILSQFENDRDRREFLDWIAQNIDNQLPNSCGKETSSGGEYQKLIDGRNILTNVSTYIKERSVIEASKHGITLNGSVWSSEKLFYPSTFRVGGDSDNGMSSSNTMHLDSFLYDEVDEDAMIESGVLSRAFCKACGSKDTEEIVFVTHSCSKDTLEYIFRSVLPPLDANQTVLDVGSRLGAVLYGAYLFSGAGKIVGIEVNKDLCDLQNHVIQSFGFSGRTSVIHADITTRSDVISYADVIILNNVFEWFVEEANHASMWQFLFANVKEGTMLVTMPSLQKSTEGIPLGFALEQWVKPLNHLQVHDTILPTKDNMSESVYLYQVISKTNHINENISGSMCDNEDHMKI